MPWLKFDTFEGAQWVRTESVTRLLERESMRLPPRGNTPATRLVVDGTLVDVQGAPEDVLARIEEAEHVSKGSTLEWDWVAKEHLVLRAPRGTVASVHFTETPNGPAFWAINHATDETTPSVPLPQAVTLVRAWFPAVPPLDAPRPV